ncbi:MAG: heterodisulfide reductase-related iron-sulfur binding cluster [Candidatus Hydrothermarchaeota archaeon]
MTTLDRIPEKVVFFEGCVTSRRMHHLRFAIRFLLENYGIDYITLDPREQCCGSPIFRAGAADIAERQLLHNLREVEKTGRNVVVTACPGCGSTLKSDEAEKRGIEVVHIMEIFMKLAEEGKLFDGNFRTLETTVTAHFPCHLIRGMDVDCFKGFKEIFAQMPGVEYIELEEANACCGAGGGVRASQIELAKKIRERKINFIKETGAKLCVTICPFCEIHIGEGLKEAELPVRIMSLPFLLALLNNNFKTKIDEIVERERSA